MGEVWKGESIMVIDPVFLDRQNQQTVQVRRRWGLPELFANARLDRVSTDKFVRKHNERLLIFRGWDDRCAYCCVQLDDTSMTVDHVIPLAKFGSDRLDNLVPACERCNAEKGDKSVREFLEGKGLCAHKILCWYECKDDANKMRALGIESLIAEFSDDQRKRLGIA